MFTIDADIKDLKVKERNLAKAFFSMNNHQVATPEMMSEEARSYIIFFREAGGKMSAYIGIHLLLTGRKLFYSSTSNPFPERDLISVEEEARSFAEGLGAMLDEVNLSMMSRDERERWIDTQDIFMPDREKSAVLSAPASPVQATPKAEAPSVLQQPQQAQTMPLAQELQQNPQAQPVSAATVIPQSAPAQQVQPDTVPPATTSPPAIQVQQQQSAQQHIPPEPIVPEPHATSAAASRSKSGKQKAEKASPEVQAEDQSREFPEQAYTKAPQKSSVSRERLEIIQEAIKAGVVKPPKPTIKKDVLSATSVVSRDREALARLLASF